jgi:hypothetical protein
VWLSSYIICTLYIYIYLYLWDKEGCKFQEFENEYMDVWMCVPVKSERA